MAFFAPLLFAAITLAGTTGPDSVITMTGTVLDSARGAAAISSLDTLVVKGWRPMASRNFAATSHTTIDSSVLLNMPGTANDINRVIALHPSVLSTGVYNNNALYVRGGHPSENAYVIDGMVFDEINHYTFVNGFGGAFGFIDPDMVKQLEIYAGGMPVSLPARTSSVIDISLRDGATDRAVYKADFSAQGFGLAGEGPLPKSAGSYLASFRFVDMSFLSNLYEKLGTPRYGDGLVKFTIDMKDAGALSIFGIGSFDLYKGIPGEPAEGHDIENHALIRSNVRAGSLTWNKTRPALSNSLQLSVSRTEAERARIYTGGRDTLVLDSSYMPLPRSRYVIDKTLLIGDRVYTVAARKKNFYAIERVSFPIGDRVDVAAGLSGEFHRIHLRFQYGIGEVQCSYQTTSDNAGNGLESAVWDTGCSSNGGIFDNDTTIDALQTGGYIQASARIGPVTIAPGVRADYYSLIKQGGLSPRLSISYRNDVLGTIAITGCMISQLPTGFDGILNNLLVNGATRESGTVELGDFRLQRCFQVTAAYSRPIGSFQTFGIEAYVKRYDHQYPMRSPESRNLGMYSSIDLNGEEALRIGEPWAGQRVHGVEATLASDRNRRFFYSTAFSYSVSRHQYVDSSWYTDKFGECKKASVLAGFSFNKEHVLTANFLAMTGRLYSPWGGWQWDISKGLLSQRLDPVYSLSVRYTFEHRFRRMTIGAYGEAINILNQKQLIDREIYAVGYSDHFLVGILPNAGVLVSF
jgi:hypothetical protein